jgi:DNA mismatch repair protein MutL
MSVPISIKPLPPATAQLIGSSQVLLDTSSVIKELVENALDAHATSITIEISSNTLDVIQVRDNGHGIAPEDRALVCKRHTTSKISNLKDLKNLGGRSLGFRGEALHSLVETSGRVSVTTRVEGESVAVKLDTGDNGEIKGYVSCHSSFEKVVGGRLTLDIGDQLLRIL